MTDITTGPSITTTHLNKPSWLVKRITLNSDTARVKSILRFYCVDTVCEHALCPNRHECYSRGTVTFLVMGSVCTRSCLFCNIQPGKPSPLEPEEPKKVANVVEQLGIRHAVITSVSRDDLEDGGAEHLVNIFYAVRSLDNPPAVELLIPDFCGNSRLISMILNVKPEIIGHNIDTVPGLYSVIRPQASYQRSLEVVKQLSEDRDVIVKSGLMLGMGEERSEVIEVLEDLYEAGCDILTLGQYLAPSPEHYPVKRYLHPDEFKSLTDLSYKIGFSQVYSGVFQRSSFEAEKILTYYNQLKNIENPQDASEIGDVAY